MAKYEIWLQRNAEAPIITRFECDPILDDYELLLRMAFEDLIKTLKYT